MCLLLASWISQGALPCSNQVWTEQAAAYPLKCLLPLRLKVFGSPILTCMLTSVDITPCADQYRFNHDKWLRKHKRKHKKHTEKMPAFSRTPLLVVTWNHYNNDLQPTLQKKQMTSASACDTVIIFFYSDATQSADTASLISHNRSYLLISMSKLLAVSSISAVLPHCWRNTRHAHLYISVTLSYKHLLSEASKG